MLDLKKVDVAKLKELVAKGRVVVEFSADWCPDCRFLEPAMPQIEADFPQSKFIKIDRDGSLDLVKSMKILGIPSFVVYQDGQEIGRLVNGDRKTKTEVEAFLHSLD